MKKKNKDSLEVVLKSNEVKRGLLTSSSRCELLSKLVFKVFFVRLLVLFG